MIETDRLIAPEATSKREDVMDRAIRPKTLDEYVGQHAVREQMSIFLQAARGRDEPLDHTLFHGFPGLGKTQKISVLGVCRAGFLRGVWLYDLDARRGLGRPGPDRAGQSRPTGKGSAR